MYPECHKIAARCLRFRAKLVCRALQFHAPLCSYSSRLLWTCPHSHNEIAMELFIRDLALAWWHSWGSTLLLACLPATEVSYSNRRNRDCPRLMNLDCERRSFGNAVSTKRESGFGHSRRVHVRPTSLWMSRGMRCQRHKVSSITARCGTFHFEFGSGMTWLRPLNFSPTPRSAPS